MFISGQGRESADGKNGDTRRAQLKTLLWQKGWKKLGVPSLFHLTNHLHLRYASGTGGIAVITWNKNPCPHKSCILSLDDFLFCNFISLNFNLKVKHFHCLFVEYYFNNYILYGHWYAYYYLLFCVMDEIYFFISDYMKHISLNFSLSILFTPHILFLRACSFICWGFYHSYTVLALLKG